jgi:hypothetical protein
MVEKSGGDAAVMCKRQLSVQMCPGLDGMTATQRYSVKRG